MSAKVALFIGIAISVLMVICIILGALMVRYGTVVPRCPEDAVILGAGEYHPNGFWDYYICGPSVDGVQPDDGRN